MIQKNNYDGLSIIETIVWLAIVSVVALLIGTLFITSLRSHKVVWDQLNAQNDGRRAISEFISDVRKAEESSLGAFPIHTATGTEFIFYANMDEDNLRERVRYWLDNEVVYRSIIKPAGTPLSYNQGATTQTIARDVVNTAQQPLFLYYTETFAGTSTPMQAPITVTDIRMVRMRLELERDANQSPVPFHTEGIVHIRNLKEN